MEVIFLKPQLKIRNHTSEKRLLRKTLTCFLGYLSFNEEEEEGRR
jgi:hypothetical protein